MNFPNQPIDYVFLQEQLTEFKHPRDKITRLLRNQDLIRVKKGLYVAGRQQRRELIDLEPLANLIYGPSYLSYEYALAHYGMIPERVYEITSATTGRNKLFETPIGRFSYQHLSLPRYQTGIIHTGTFLIASREKALVDVIAKQKPFKNWKDLREFLIESLRIEEEALSNLDSLLLQEISASYQNPNVRLLAQIPENL